MLVEIWLLFAAVGIVLFIIGLLYASRQNGKVFLLFMSLLFLIITTYYSFYIEKVGFSGGAVMTETFRYTIYAMFFGMLTILNAVLIIVFTISDALRVATK